jgi:hypothetical protein
MAARFVQPELDTLRAAAYDLIEDVEPDGLHDREYALAPSDRRQRPRPLDLPASPRPAR